MKKPLSPLSCLLLPVKNSELFLNVLPLLELFSHNLGQSIEKIDLLHVVGGSFLSTHLGNIDFRAGRILTSDIMKRLRQQHYQETVNPMLDQVQELLQKSGTDVQANILVENGDPVKIISAICEKGKYSSLIMCRHKHTEDGIFSGSILNGVLHRHFIATIYVIGESGFAVNTSPAARVVIGVDGSPASERAVQEAAVLLSKSGSFTEKISLAHVMDQACLVDETSMSCQEAGEAGERYLQEASNVLMKMGVEESLISSELLFGKPAEALCSHADALNATMLYIGRRDRSNISEVLLGSVCGDIINRCREAAVVLVC